MQEQPNKNTEHSNPNNWRFIFYFAPKDPNVIVPKRWGYGSTLNFARAESYLILATPFLIGAAIVACVWLAQ